ncbi:MAG TPA: tetratricopeptide repeat protein [Blastocatellia bacterium]|nr:tetratricopeptide repeat protein [Blastocatellia bacterium]
MTIKVGAIVLMVSAAGLLFNCGSHGARSILEQAEDAWDSGDYKTSAQLFEKYLEQEPAGSRAADARYQLANIYYFNLHRFDQARAQYLAFLEQDPGNQNAQVARERLAEVLGELGRSYEAIAEYENLNPQDGSERRRIRLRIADLYFAQNNYSQALTEYEKVVEGVAYDELSEQAYLREASIYHIARGQYQLALPVYEKLAASSPDGKVRVRAKYGLADCYAGMFRFEDAIKTLRSIGEGSEQAYISQRVSELEQRRREAGQAQTRLKKQ